MTTATGLLDRIEEYNYYSAGFPEPRNLTLVQLYIRLSAFHRVLKKVQAASKAAGGPSKSKSSRRRGR